MLCAYVKDLKSNKCSIIDNTNELFTIKEVRKDKEWKREPFNAEEFMQRRQSKKKGKEADMEYFGIVCGKYMHKIAVIEIGDSHDELKKKVMENRPHIPRRLSSSEAGVPLSYFLKYEEKTASKIAAKPTKAKERKEKAVTASSQHDNILKRATAKVMKQQPESSSVQVTVPLEMEGTEVPLEMDSTTVPLVIESTNVTDLGKESSLESTSRQVPSQHVLLKKIASLRKQRDMAIAEATALRFQIDDLKKKGNQYREKVCALKEEVNRLSQASCKLKDLKYAVDLEDAYKDLVLPASEVYIGKGRTIPRQKLKYIEEQEVSFNKRGELIFNLIQPDGLHNYSKTGHGKSEGGKKKFDPVDMAAVKGILSAMFYADNTEVTEKKMSLFFQKQPNEVQRRIQNAKRKAQGTAEEKPVVSKRVKSDEAEDGDQVEHSHSRPSEGETSDVQEPSNRDADIIEVDASQPEKPEKLVEPEVHVVKEEPCSSEFDRSYDGLDLSPFRTDNTEEVVSSDGENYSDFPLQFELCNNS